MDGPLSKNAHRKQARHPAPPNTNSTLHRKVTSCGPRRGYVAIHDTAAGDGIAVGGAGITRSPVCSRRRCTGPPWNRVNDQATKLVTRCVQFTVAERSGSTTLRFPLQYGQEGCSVIQISRHCGGGGGDGGGVAVVCGVSGRRTSKEWTITLSCI